MRVEIEPLSHSLLEVPLRLRPAPPPVFHGLGEPSLADRQLALALLLELDPESRRWYLHGRGSMFCGLPVPAKFLPEPPSS